MRDALYKMMKQVGDPTAFTEILNDVVRKIQNEELAAEERQVKLDDARFNAAAALTDYFELAFDLVEEYAGEKQQMTDEIAEFLETIEEECGKYLDLMKKFRVSKAPAKLKKDACSCGGNCSCGNHDVLGKPELERVIDTEDAHIEVHKVPVRKDVDVDTVINEFLKSLQ